MLYGYSTFSIQGLEKHNILIFAAFSEGAQAAGALVATRMNSGYEW